MRESDLTIIRRTVVFLYGEYCLVLDRSVCNSSGSVWSALSARLYSFTRLLKYIQTCAVDSVLKTEIWPQVGVIICRAMKLHLFC